MEKQAAKAKNKFLKLIPKAASSFNFQNLPFSPGKDQRSDIINSSIKSKNHIGKGFSGPMVSIIPVEARRKSSSNHSIFMPQEPTSPKISCMGQIKHKKKLQQNNSSTSNNKTKARKSSSSTMKPVLSPSDADTKKKTSSIKTFFGSSKSSGRKSDASADIIVSSLPDRAVPSLSQMKQFASSRDTFANFDWKKAQVAPEVSDDHSDGEDEIIIPFSAPIVVRNGRCQGVCGRGGAAATAVVSSVALDQRKEINLWKRRTMAQPAPLQVNNFVRSNR